MSELDEIKREVQEVKAEVRTIRVWIKGALVVAGIVLAIILPDLLMLAAVIGVCILFALLVSPVRHLIFPSVFSKGKTRRP